MANSPDQEPWSFGETCERISRRFIELRYHLLPYIYTAFWQSAQQGLPVMRPLALAFQEDTHATGIDDQFLFGDAFLVAPVLEPKATSRRAYIPQGRWYDFWKGALTAGPQIARLDAPISQIPLLVRAGSVVPAWPTMQYSAERPVEQLILHVYPGEGLNWLYEDDGHTWAFDQGKGDCRVTRFACSLAQAKDENAGRTLRLSRSVEGPYTPAYERIQIAVHGLAEAPARVRVDDQAVAESQYDDVTRTLTVEAGLFDSIEID
jgi:alpha-glucosidase